MGYLVQLKDTLALFNQNWTEVYKQIEVLQLAPFPFNTRDNAALVPLKIRK